MARGMTIGELARAADVGVETIRYYERLGLLRQPPAQGGYRRYDEAELRKLRYIRNAKSLRLSLKDIAALQRQLAGGPQFCVAVRALVAKRLEEVERQAAELNVLRGELRAFLTRCSQRPADQPCPVAADLGSPITPASAAASRPAPPAA